MPKREMLMKSMEIIRFPKRLLFDTDAGAYLVLNTFYFIFLLHLGHMWVLLLMFFETLNKLFISKAYKIIHIKRHSIALRQRRYLPHLSKGLLQRSKALKTQKAQCKMRSMPVSTTKSVGRERVFCLVWKWTWNRHLAQYNKYSINTLEWIPDKFFKIRIFTTRCCLSWVTFWKSLHILKNKWQ